MNTFPKIHIRAGREKSLLRHHPWIFSGAVEKITGSPSEGAIVDVCAHNGHFIGRGYYSSKSQITVRVLTFKADEAVDEVFIRNIVMRASGMRTRAGAVLSSDSYRLIFSESDGLPGVIVDKYGDYLVCQFSTAGSEKLKPLIVSALNDIIQPKGIYDRSDVDSRSHEGLKPEKGLLLGAEPPEFVQIVENGIQLLVDIRNGHKTGFYLDQRESRRRLGEWIEGAGEVLNVFSYTGGFSISALKAGAGCVTNIDSSQGALNLCAQNVGLNGIDSAKSINITGDAFRVLREMSAEGRQFDIIVLDPPKFADSKAQVMKACRGYKDINMVALRILKPGGRLFTFSCSGLLEADLFQKIVADAALDAKCSLQFVERLSQPCDHPIHSAFPESAYLKGFVCVKI